MPELLVSRELSVPEKLFGANGVVRMILSSSAHKGMWVFGAYTPAGHMLAYFGIMEPTSAEETQASAVDWIKTSSDNLGLHARVIRSNVSDTQCETVIEITHKPPPASPWVAPV